MSGTGIINVNGGMTLGGSFTTLSGRTLNNPVTVTVIGNSGGYFTISGGGVVNNLSGATWDYHNDAAINSSGTATFNNAGTFEKTAGSGATQVLPLFTNTGTVNAETGNFSFTGGAVTIGGSGCLTSEPGTTISFTGNLLGATQNADQFNPNGNVLLDGAGNSSSPQLLEAMSQDLGAVAAGFARNFVYNTLTIGGSDYVRLVDQSQNTNSGAPEALYVDTLIVPAASTFDLNGLHVYARLVSNKGTILDGAVQQLPPGGALALNSIAPAYDQQRDPDQRLDLFRSRQPGGHRRRSYRLAGYSAKSRQRLLLTSPKSRSSMATATYWPRELILYPAPTSCWPA